MLPQYATVADYTAWAGGEADNHVDDAMLARASRRIDQLTAGVPYERDADGFATNPLHRAALVVATSAQAHWFTEMGDTSGVLATMAGASIGSVRLPTLQSGGAAGATDPTYAPEAVQVLRVNGLLNVVVEH